MSRIHGKVRVPVEKPHDLKRPERWWIRGKRWVCAKMTSRISLQESKRGWSVSDRLKGLHWNIHCIFIAYTFTDADIHKCLSFMAMHVLFQFPGKGEVVAPSMVSSELVGQESAFTRCKLLAAWETAEDEGGVGRWREGGEVEGRRRSGTKEPKAKAIERPSRVVLGARWWEAKHSASGSGFCPVSQHSNFVQTERRCKNDAPEKGWNSCSLDDMSNKSGSVLKAFVL